MDKERCLHWAVDRGNLEVLILLLEHGVDVHTDDDYALRRASSNGHLEIVRLLLERGADISVWDNSAIYWASYNKHHDVVELLESHVKICEEEAEFENRVIYNPLG